jgi:hypothetical protein
MKITANGDKTGVPFIRQFLFSQREICPLFFSKPSAGSLTVFHILLIGFSQLFAY